MGLRGIDAEQSEVIPPGETVGEDSMGLRGIEPRSTGPKPEILSIKL
jgi:hypothetical protein